MRTASTPAPAADFRRPSLARITKNAAANAKPAATVSDRPRPTKYHGVPSVNVASVPVVARSAVRNPPTGRTSEKASKDPASRHEASTYVSPTLESPNTRCRAPLIQRYKG